MIFNRYEFRIYSNPGMPPNGFLYNFQTGTISTPIVSVFHAIGIMDALIKFGIIDPLEVAELMLQIHDSGLPEWTDHDDGFSFQLVASNQLGPVKNHGIYYPN